MKNKIIFFCCLSFTLFVLSAKAQDTISNNLSRSSISFTAGTNIVYPNIKQYSYDDEILNPFERDYYNFEITPKISVSPNFLLTYNYLFHQHNHLSFALNLGTAFIQYRYKIIANGSYQNGLRYNNLTSHSGTFNAEEQFNVFEINIGVSANYKIKNKITWHNKIGIIAGWHTILFPPLSTDAPGGLPAYLITGSDSNNYGSYVNLFYNMGIDIQLSKNISIMPEFTLPLLDINSFRNNYPMSLVWFGQTQNANGIYPIFSSLRTGITLTYHFNKK